MKRWKIGVAAGILLALFAGGQGAGILRGDHASTDPAERPPDWLTALGRPLVPFLPGVQPSAISGSCGPDAVGVFTVPSGGCEVVIATADAALRGLTIGRDGGPAAPGRVLVTPAGGDTTASELPTADVTRLVVLRGGARLTIECPACRVRLGLHQ